MFVVDDDVVPRRLVLAERVDELAVEDVRRRRRCARGRVRTRAAAPAPVNGLRLPGVRGRRLDSGLVDGGLPGVDGRGLRRLCHGGGPAIRRGGDASVRRGGGPCVRRGGDASVRLRRGGRFLARPGVRVHGDDGRHRRRGGRGGDVTRLRAHRLDLGLRVLHEEAAADAGDDGAGRGDDDEGRDQPPPRAPRRGLDRGDVVERRRLGWAGAERGLRLAEEPG